MIRGIDLLREASRELAVGEQTAEHKLQQGILRFMLEYRQPPELNTERERFTQMLEHGNFELFAIPGDDAGPVADLTEDFGHFVVLQFPFLERTLSQRSLFEIGYALEVELDLISAEPDLANRFYQEPQQSEQSDDKQTEGVISDAFTANCWVDKPAPDNRQWPLEVMRIQQAWRYSGVLGEGVIIAQPDTGVAHHEALSNANLRLDLGINLVEGNDDPTDPLNESANTPGHGTATSSVIVAPHDSPISGAAPGAELVPIRCVDDVRIFDAAPIVAAVNHARSIGCHVITISLGGLRNRALKKAIKSAIANNIIVVTAAGNCVEVVVWPARHAAVIGVGGTNIDDMPWKGSSRGSGVDISAPAELVWVARRRPGDQQVGTLEGAQGTSYATALTAGVAALWLSHHGRERLIVEAQRAGMSLQSFFRHAVQVTARKPEDWTHGNYGAGIVDAEALLKLAPEYISQQVIDDAKDPMPAQSPADQLLSQLDGAVVSGAASSEDIKVRRFGRELSAIALESARLGNLSDSAVSAESIVADQEISRTLQEAIGGAAGPVFAALSKQKPAPPAARVSHSIHSVRSEALINRLQVDRARIETADSARIVSSTLDKGGIKNLLDKLAHQIDVSPLVRNSTLESRDTLKHEVLSDAEEVLQKILGGEDVSPNNVRSNTAFEALVKMQGRPVIKMDDTPIDLNDPNLQEWAGKIGMVYRELPKLSGSVGRIDMDGIHQGTGFVVAPGIVMTNRHVIEGFAAPIPTASKPDRWLIERRATINFSPEANNASKEFVIQDILFSGPDRISGDPLINHDELDMALVAVEETNTVGTALPKKLCPAASASIASANSIVFLIGYPAAPSSYPKDENGIIRLEVVERLRELFGVEFGRCYLSPGLVEVPVTDFNKGVRSISFAHDATSLGGSSGSCLINYSSNPDVVGLHYGGDWLRANFAHDLSHVSRSLIKIPQLISEIAAVEQRTRESVQLAVQTSKIDDSVDLSAQQSRGGPT